MRLSLLALLLLATVAAPRAQVYQGLVELGGSASFQSTEGDTVLRFALAVGYFFTDALEAGVRLDYVKREDADGNGALLLFGAYHFG